MGTPLKYAPATLRNSSKGRPTIVVGLDGSSTSWDALWWAFGEADRLEQARVLAVYVSCRVDANAGLAAAAGIDCGQQTLALLDAQRQQAAELKLEVLARGRELGVEVSFVHCEGDPGAELLRLAKDAQADVLAVGRSCKLRHQLAGSLGRRLASKRNAPIVVVVP